MNNLPFQEVIAILDKDRQIELSINFFTKWFDPRIFHKNATKEMVNLNIDREKIFLPDFYIYSLFELQRTEMFLGSSETVNLRPDRVIV